MSFETNISPAQLSQFASDFQMDWRAVMHCQSLTAMQKDSSGQYLSLLIWKSPSSILDQHLSGCGHTTSRLHRSYFMNSCSICNLGYCYIVKQFFINAFSCYEVKVVFLAYPPQTQKPVPSEIFASYLLSLSFSPSRISQNLFCSLLWTSLSTNEQCGTLCLVCASSSITS